MSRPGGAVVIDLDAYFERIGYAGGRAPDLDTLRALIVRHTESIAFENLDPLLGRPVRLDAASLQQKLVQERRGGYCFEQNLLLSHILQALGFEVSGLAARVMWNTPESMVVPRAHMVVRIELAGTTYIADVGFGGLTLTGVLRLAAGIEQPTPHEPFRLLDAGTEYILQARVNTDWRSLYRFDLQPQLLPDYEVTSWYLSNHPGSRFVRNLVAARPTADRRLALFNDEFAVHHLGGPSERRRLTSVGDIRAVLEEHFLLPLPAAPELDAKLAPLIAGR